MIDDTRFVVETAEGEAMEVVGPPRLLNVLEMLLALHPEVHEAAHDTYVVAPHLVHEAQTYWEHRGLA